MLHRFCISAEGLRTELRRSPGYVICNRDGTANDVGDWYRTPSGQIKEVQGVCDHPDDRPCTGGITVLGPIKSMDELVPEDTTSRLDESFARLQAAIDRYMA